MSLTKLLNKKEAAEMLRTTKRGIDGMVSRRKIPYIKMGKMIRFSTDQLEIYIEKHTIKTKAVS